MKTWFTADTHFGHINIIKYCNRPFNSIQEHDEVLIENWNKLIRPKDTVYHLGDFAFGDHNIDRVAKQLNGNIFLILGNHDVKSKNKLTEWFRVRDVVHGKFNGYKISLFHYPMRSWPSSHYGAGHLFGHEHGTFPPHGRSFDIGVDAQEFFPVELDEIIARFETMPILSHH